jgi:hypothetical protein
MSINQGLRHRPRPLSSLLAAAAVAACLSSGSFAQDDAASRQRNLESFIHYTIVGRGDLAAASANALLASGITDEELAELVDEAGLAARIDQALLSGRRLEGVETVAGELTVKIERGRFNLATDGDRIKDSMGMLTGNVRGRMLGRDRLAAAGPYAVRPLLEVLVSGEDPILVSEVEALLVQRIRDAAVLPLCEALPSLAPQAQERVLFVLGAIGAPSGRTAMPFIAELVAASPSDVTSAKGREAIDRLGGTAEDPSAQFTALADRFFRLDESLVALPPQRSLAAADSLDVWSYGNFSGLEPTPVAKSLWFDVMAMRMAERALELDAGNRQALALFIASDLRRGLTLASLGATDPIYGGQRYSPEFFATAAGPSIAQDVLGLALSVKDTPLVRRAISVLAATAGSESMIRAGEARPMVEALGYPGRRVRIEAALAIASAMPRTAFPGDHAVVPILASAVRSDAAFAIVIASDLEERRQVSGALANAGYTVLPGGPTFAEAEVSILGNAGVDLIVVRGNAEAIAAAHASTRGAALTNAVPFVAIASAFDAGEAGTVLRDDAAAMAMTSSGDEDAMIASVRSFLEQTLGSAMDVNEAREYAILSLEALKAIALSDGSVLSIADAEAPLSEALATERGALRVMIAEVLAMIGSDAAQQALIDAAISAGDGDQVDLLDQAAASARRFGNRSHPSQASALIGLIRSSSGDVADAAGRLYGSLDLPVSATVGWILE